MSGRNEPEYLFQEAARRARPRPHRQARFPDSQLGDRSWFGWRRHPREVGITPEFAADRPLNPNVLSMDLGPASGHRRREQKFPESTTRSLRSRLRHRTLCRRAKNKRKQSDVYIGQTPFVEMSAFIETGVIEPWDNYIPKDVIDDIIRRFARNVPSTASSIAGRSSSTLSARLGIQASPARRACPTLRRRRGMSSCKF